MNIPKNANNYQVEIIKYAIAAYGFLIPNNQDLTYQEFANLIKEHYSLDNPQNAEVCRVLEEVGNHG